MTDDYHVKDLSLAEDGLKRMEWAEAHMPVLMSLRKKYSGEKPLSGQRIAGAIHVTKETAVLIRTLKALGAEVAWAGCNPLSTQDDVAAQLAKEGVRIHAWRGNHNEYYDCIDAIISTEPTITMDDGADVVFRLHNKRPELLSNVLGGTEETTTGVHRLENMSNDGALKYPIIAVNNAITKWEFDNVLGTGQGAIDGLLRSTSVLIAGKTFVVAGYGHCGRGVAMRAKGMGANVIVTEVNPLNALKAVMAGYRVMPMHEAAALGDIFVTTTGNKNIVTKEHFPLLKDGAVLSNVGHFDVEVRADQLRDYAVSSRIIRPNTEEFTLPNGNKAYLIAEGRLANLGAAEGHPSEVMDLSFSNQVLSLIHLVKNKGGLSNTVHYTTLEQDERIAKVKLESMGFRIDELSDEQKKYAESWDEGT